MEKLAMHALSRYTYIWHYSLLHAQALQPYCMAIQLFLTVKQSSCLATAQFETPNISFIDAISFDAIVVYIDGSAPNCQTG